MAKHKFLNPDTIAKPVGYTHVVEPAAPGPVSYTHLTLPTKA